MLWVGLGPAGYESITDACSRGAPIWGLVSEHMSVACAVGAAVSRSVMVVISQADVEQLLAVGNESQSFEVKGPGNLSDKAFVAKIARAVMAMGNRRDGGVLCVGVLDAQMKAMLPGLDGDQAGQWADFDNVADALGRYADPAVVFELEVYTLSSGAIVAVLDIAEFDLVPHVCKRTFPGELQDGMTYVRPRGKPESVPVPNSAEMRALLDLATAKGVRDFVRTAGGAGIVLEQLESQDELDTRAYEAERTAAWQDLSPTLVGIVGGGHCDVAVRPTTYSPHRVGPVALEAFVIDNTVRLRGWPVPFFDDRTPRRRYGTWVGQDVAAEVTPHQESWRMLVSGQFLHRRLLATDRIRLGDPQAERPGVVMVWDVLLYVVEIAEFGARMATGLDVPSITFDVALRGISGRELISGDRNRELDGPYLMAADSLHATVAVDSARLLTATRDVGVEVAQLLLTQFGLKVPDQLLLDWQAQVFYRS